MNTPLPTGAAASPPACTDHNAPPSRPASGDRHTDLTAPHEMGPAMNEEPESKRWISLGLLFGGHTVHPEVMPSTPAESGPPDTPAPYTTEEREDEETMRAAGYEPKVRFPGARSMPWPSECITCGEPRKPSLQDVERGMRCQHVWGRRSAPSRR